MTPISIFILIYDEPRFEMTHWSFSIRFHPSFTCDLSLKLFLFIRWLLSLGAALTPWVSSVTQTKLGKDDEKDEVLVNV